jgi:hypothetical protein
MTGTSTDRCPSSRSFQGWVIRSTVLILCHKVKTHVIRTKAAAKGRTGMCCGWRLTDDVLWTLFVMLTTWDLP